MRTTSLPLCAAVVAAVTAFATENQAALVVDSASRGVALANMPNDTVDNTPTTAGIYSNTITDSSGVGSTLTSGEASQNTNFAPLVFGGSGASSITSSTESEDEVSAVSLLTITFTIDSPYAWTLTGKLGESQGATGGAAFGAVFFDGPGDPILSLLSPLNGEIDLANAGIIDPGTYTFSLAANSFGTDGENSEASARFVDVFLTLTPIPEPASLSLLALGSLALLSKKRK